MFSASSKSLDAESSVKTFIREITTQEETYEIVVGGYLDGENCRYPSAYYQSPPVYEPNISLTIENIGNTPIKNPRVKLSQTGMWFTIEELLADIITSGMTDAEKARAIYEFHIRHRAHAGETLPGSYLNPLKFYQGFGFSICSNDSFILGAMWQAAGLKVRFARPYNHSVPEVYYDGAWHLFDGDTNGFYLDYDNATVVSDIELARDHYLVKRAHNYGLLDYDYFSPRRIKFMNDHKVAGLYYDTSPNTNPPLPLQKITQLEYVLRPEESLTLTWQNADKFCFYNPERYYVKLLYNGSFTYKPVNLDLFLKYGCLQQKNVQINGNALEAQTCDEEAWITVPVISPYPVVGGKLELNIKNLEEQDSLKIYLSNLTKKLEKTMKEISHTRGDVNVSLVLDKSLTEIAGDKRDGFLITILWSDANPTRKLQLSDLQFMADLQLAPLGLPSLRCGKNAVRFKSDSPGTVRITHKWRESTATQPPAPPAAPVYPPNKAQINSLRFTFRWKEAIDPDGDSISDYHFLLSDRADCCWALSTNFEKIISRTQNAGKAEYTIPYDGLLNSGQTYYWKVRARDEHGVWGEWSQVWEFTPYGPARPTDIQYTIEDNKIKLHWRPSPKGTPPRYYEIFASNESGFSPDSEPHFVLGLSPLPQQEIFLEREYINIYDVHGELVKIPGNLILKTQETSALVVADELPFSGGFNRCYYRLQAVDEYGARSGCTPQIELPRPFIYSRPPASIKIAQPFTYQVRSLYSLGPVIADKPEYTYSLRRLERVNFSLEGAPEGLKIDPQTGLISGTINSLPEDGELTFRIIATINEKTAKQEVKLKAIP